MTTRRKPPSNGKARHRSDWGRVLSCRCRQPGDAANEVSTLLDEGDMFRCLNKDCGAEVIVTTATLPTSTGNQAELTCCGTAMVREAG
jgi:hypothetical protein